MQQVPRDSNINAYRDPSSDSLHRRNNCPLHCSTEFSAQQQQHSSPKYVPRRHGSNNSSPSLDFGRDGNLETHWSRILVRVHTTIDRNERRLIDQDNREKTELEWKQVALVSDRALLCVFFLTTIISTAVILCGSPPASEVTLKG